MPPPENFPGLTVSDPALRATLLWDGDCGLCRSSVGLLHRLARRPIRALPSQEAGAALPQKAAATAGEQVLWIGLDGAIYGGSQAIAQALRAAGRPVLAFLIGNPALRPFARAAYRLIARHRRNLSCAGR
jgi:predicted DCC family thiol-disulfide oxidoreductase YuxK